MWRKRSWGIRDFWNSEELGCKKWFIYRGEVKAGKEDEKGDFLRDKFCDLEVSGSFFKYYWRFFENMTTKMKYKRAPLSRKDDKI